MIYCVSDIHGNYDKYKCILEQIHLGTADELYVLGDVVDRGPQPMAILQDMMMHPNVIPLIGNHEFMAMQCLQLLMQEITDENIARFADKIQGLSQWMNVGGTATVEDFRRLSREERYDILEYLEEFSAFAEVSAGGNDYVLVHAGLAGFTPERPLEDYALHELLFTAPAYGRVYYPDRFLVTGHLPTRNIADNADPDRIFRANNHIAIDCGCEFGGPLAAICLDTGEEFYA